MRFLNASVLERKSLNRNLLGLPLGNLLPKTRVLKHRVLERKRRPNANASVLGTQRSRTLSSSGSPSFSMLSWISRISRQGCKLPCEESLAVQGSEPTPCDVWAERGVSSGSCLFSPTRMGVHDQPSKMFTLPALQKNFVNIFFVFAWEFCFEKNGWDF